MIWHFREFAVRVIEGAGEELQEPAPVVVAERRGGDIKEAHCLQPTVLEVRRRVEPTVVITAAAATTTTTTTTERLIGFL